MTPRKVRKVTNQLLEHVDEGVLDARDVLALALMYMSEADVADMAHINNLIDEEEA